LDSNRLPRLDLRVGSKVYIGGEVVPMATLHVRVGGMHCSLCTQSIERALRRLDGVDEVRVSLAHEEVLVRYDPVRVPAAALTDTLRDLGYTVRDPDRADVFSEEERELARARRIAVTTGSLVAVATLLMIVALWGNPALVVRKGMLFAQAALALVASFGPARFVYRNAWQSLRRRILNQDVLAAAAALAGLAGGTAGLVDPRFPGAAFFAATTYILAFHAVGGYASVLVHVRASQSVRRLLSLQPATARRVNERGDEEEVLVDELRPGDRIRIRPGERIPVDGRIVRGSTAVDERLVTGEPLPRDCQPGDEIVGGSINLTGAIEVEVTRTGDDSFLHRVARQVAEARAMKPGILRLVDRVLLLYVPVVFTLAAAGGLFWLLVPWLTGGRPDGVRAAYAALGALVMGYPCALGMATPLAIIRASGEAAARGILMRSGEAFQVFRLVDTVVFDKTGTLTEGRPQVVAVQVAGLPRENGAPTVDDVTAHPTPAHAGSPADPLLSAGDQASRVLALAAAAERPSEHPLGQAVVDAATARGLVLPEAEAFTAKPGRGVVAHVEGQEILVGSERLLAECGVVIDEATSRWATEQQQRGRTVVYVAADGRLAGAVALADRLKEDAPVTLAALRRRGLRTVIASGDHDRAVAAAAREVGADEFHARLLPEDKRRLVVRLQQEGRKVAFVGDGINDAPSLMQADVGIAIGAGTDIAIESADVVLPGRRLVAVVEARALAAASYGLTLRNVLLALGFNATGVLASLSGLVHPMWAMLAMAASLTVVLSHTLATRLTGAGELPS